MSKKMMIFFIALSVCCAVLGFFGLKMSLNELNSDKEMISFAGKIVSYSYNEYSKYPSFYLEAESNGKQVIIEISNLYVDSFNREIFEKDYSENREYTFVSLQQDYDNGDVVSVVGMKSDSGVLLDENIALKNIHSNAVLGMIFSVLLFAGAGFFIFLSFKYKCKEKEVKILDV